MSSYPPAPGSQSGSGSGFYASPPARYSRSDLGASIVGVRSAAALLRDSEEGELDGSLASTTSKLRLYGSSSLVRQASTDSLGNPAGKGALPSLLDVMHEIKVNAPWIVELTEIEDPFAKLKSRRKSTAVCSALDKVRENYHLQQDLDNLDEKIQRLIQKELPWRG